MAVILEIPQAGAWEIYINNGISIELNIPDLGGQVKIKPIHLEGTSSRNKLVGVIDIDYVTRDRALGPKIEKLLAGAERLNLELLYIFDVVEQSEEIVIKDIKPKEA
jgi:hypothetical protein